MRKRTYFLARWRNEWPEPGELERSFSTVTGREKLFASGLDGGSLVGEGLYGTENLEPYTGRVDVYLYFAANPECGLSLQYTKWDGRQRRNETYNSKGDLGRLNEFVRSFSGTPLSIGLFVQFDLGSKAIREFIETDGELPTCIEWIANKDLPPGTFPDP